VELLLITEGLTDLGPIVLGVSLTVELLLLLWGGPGGGKLGEEADRPQPGTEGDSLVFGASRVFEVGLRASPGKSMKGYRLWFAM